MDKCKKDITPLLMHWSYVFFARTPGYVPEIYYQFVYLHMKGIKCVNEGSKQEAGYDKIHIENVIDVHLKMKNLLSKSIMNSNMMPPSAVNSLAPGKY